MSPEDFQKQIDEQNTQTSQEQDKKNLLALLVKVVSELQNIRAGKQLTISGTNDVTDQLSQVLSALKQYIDSPVALDNQPVVDGLTKLHAAIRGIRVAPTINVPETKVITTPVDFKPVLAALSDIKGAITSTELPEAIDLTPITDELKTVVDTLSNLKFPTANFILPFKDINGKATQVQLDSSGNIPIAGSPSGTQDVNITKVAGSAISQGHGTAATAIRVELPTDGTGVINSLQSGTWNIGTLTSLTNALPAGTNVIGHVITDSGSTTAVTGTVTVSGTVTTTPPSNASTNISQINGITPLMGNGVTGTGSQRVTIASDNTAFSVNATLSAETTKVIGTVNQGTSPWVISGAVTNTVLSVVGGGTEATAQRVTLASDSTGVLTVKQATAANLNATVVGTGTFAVQAAATLAAETTKVIGVTRTADGSGNLLTSTGNALDINIKTGNLTTLPVTNAGTFAVQTTPTAPTTIYNGKKTVTTAGTRVTLAASQAVKSVVIKALAANTGIIYVGDGSVASTTGFALAAGEIVSLDIANLATVNLDSSVNGEGVTYVGTN